MSRKKWKRREEMTEEERLEIWSSDLTDDERRDMGVPKFTTLGNGMTIQNWSSEEDEYQFFKRNANCYGFTSPQSRVPRAPEEPAQETRRPDADA